MNLLRPPPSIIDIYRRASYGAVRRLMASPPAASGTAPASSPSGGKPKVLILTGPTAVGKTQVSLALAERLNGEIISADSVQVYRGLDIGSDKVRPTPHVSVASCRRCLVPLVFSAQPPHGRLLAGPPVRSMSRRVLDRCRSLRRSSAASPTTCWTSCRPRKSSARGSSSAWRARPRRRCWRGGARPLWRAAPAFTCAGTCWASRPHRRGAGRPRRRLSQG